ncbi:class I adenylate-forming enzyme family protein [Bacillales bacterium AN1005]
MGITNIYNLFEKCSRLYMDKIMVYESNNQYSYSYIRNRVYYRRRELENYGFKKGDILLVCSQDHISILELMLACWSLQGIVAIVNYELKRLDKELMKEYINPKMIYEDKELQTYSATFADTITPDLCNAAYISFSTGTSNKPKGIVHSHRGLILNAKKINAYLKLSHNDKCLNLKPLHHVASLSSLILPSIMAGSELHFKRNDDLLSTTTYVYEKKITFIDVSATVLKYISYFSERQVLDCPLRIISVNGEHLSAEEITNIKKKFPNALIYYAYGMSEAGPRITYLDTDLYPNKLESVGKPLEEIELSILNHDEHNQLEGERKIGEIVINTPSLMIGYYKNNLLTNKTIGDGLLKTGDLGYIDKEGFLYVLGRVDGQISRGGVAIYPYEIEDMIKMMPRVTDCVVTESKDTMNGNRVIAFVSVSGHVEVKDIYNFCNSNLPLYLVPQSIFIVDEIPMKNGKLLRTKL